MVEEGGFLGRADSQGYSLVDKAAVKHTATSASNSPWTRCGAQIGAAKGPHDTTLNRRPGESADRGCQMSKFCAHSAGGLTKPGPTIAAARRALLAELSPRCRQRSGPSCSSRHVSERAAGYSCRASCPGNARTCRAAGLCGAAGYGVVLWSWWQLLERPRVAVGVAEGNERAPRLNVNLTGLHAVCDQFPARRLDIRHDDLDAFL